MPNQRPFVNEELLLKRYVQGDEKTWHDVASRVANHASKHGSEYDFERYYDLIHGGKFFPSRMTYMGTGHAFASSCFVFPVEDSLTGIMKTLNDACQVQKYGGGTGYNFSHLRPKGDLISTSGGDASGPVSFMGLFHNAMEVVHRAGKKHAAQMGILNCDHPDIFEFIHCKDQEGAYWTFNISVAVTDKFMDAVEGNLSWDLQFKGKVYKTIPARELWDAIVTHAWGNGDPGIIFLDTVNRFNRYPEPIEACNPCVAAGTLVNTPDGYRRVEEIQVGDIVSTLLGSEPVKTIETHNECPIYNVRFSDGGSQFVTAAHRYHVLDAGDKTIRRKRLDECRVGDYVQVCAAPLSHRGTEASYQFGLKQGILLGDGCYTDNKLNATRNNVLTIASDQMQPEFNEKVLNLFGSTRQSWLDAKSNSMALHIPGARALVAELGLTPAGSHTKQIDITQVTSFNHALGLIDGLLATDGNVNLNRTNPMIRWKTVSCELATNIRQLLLLIGCHARIYEVKTTPSEINGRTIQHRDKSYEVVLLGENALKLAQVSRVGELHSDKGGKLDDLATDYLLTGDTRKAKIVAIEPAGTATVYDLYCERSDTWITEGYVQQGCGEQMLPPYVSCNLGSIDLSRFVIEKKIDWQSLDNAVRGAVSFLDDSLDSAFWPVEEVQVKTAKYRNIGLGVMGWSDMCIMLGFAYDSNDAVELGDEVMCFINSVADDESMLRGGGNRKNVTVTSIAPTGSISMLAGCSSGIEPLFGIVTTKNTYVGSFHNVHWLFEKIAKERGFYSDELIKIVAERGSVQGLSDVPTDVQELFKTTTEIDWEWHVKHQAAFQKHTDNAVSKCLARGTLIQTSQGLVAIESFSNNNSPDSFSPVSGLLTSMGEPITQHYYAGSKPATRVRLNNGAEIVGSTESHRILTLDGWKRLSDMQVGDMVVGKFIESHGIGGMPIQWKDDFRSNANRVATPKQMTIDLAKFLGMLAADGNFTESTGAVNLTHKNQAVEREYIRLCQNLFGLTPRRTVDKRNDVVSLTISSRNLVRYTHFLIGFDAFTKKVPTQILMGSAEEKLAFVSGLTLDGYITRGVLCVYEGRSKELAYQVFEICNSFGLPKVNMRRKAVHGYGGHVYAVSVSNKLQEMIDPIEVHKRGSANVKYLVAAPSVAVDSAKVGVHHDAYYNWRSLNQRQPGCCWNTVADQLGIESKTPVYKVVSLEDAGMVEMYDVEVEGSHSYITNGIVSHNTINMASNAMVFDVSAAYMTAYDAGCKSITVYRDGSRQVQVMDNKAGARDMCPNCKAILFMKDGEKVCVTCGYKKTSLDEKTSLISEAKRARPAHLNGTTYRKDTPIGKAYVTVNTDAHGEPFEVFMNVGKAGSEVAAVSEGLGRLISLVLRMPSSVTPVERLRWIVDEISDIGGGRPMGFGAKRVRSLPDGIAQVLSEHLSGGNGTVDESPVASTKSLGDICPECGEATLLNVEGCRKCQSCGYSEC